MRVEVDPGVVQQFRCFQELGDAEAGAVALLLEPVHLSAGQLLFRQGDPADMIYFLVSGQVEIRMGVHGQPDHVCATLDAGSIFGEIGPLLNEPRSAAAVACTEADLWQMPRDLFHQAIHRGESWASKFLLASLRVMARRLIAMNQQVMSLIGDLRLGDVKIPAPTEADVEELCSRDFDDELLGVLKRSLL